MVLEERFKPLVPGQTQQSHVGEEAGRQCEVSLPASSLLFFPLPHLPSRPVDLVGPLTETTHFSLP